MLTVGDIDTLYVLRCAVNCIKNKPAGWVLYKSQLIIQVYSAHMKGGNQCNINSGELYFTHFFHTFKLGLALLSSQKERNSVKYDNFNAWTINTKVFWLVFIVLPPKRRNGSSDTKGKWLLHGVLKVLYASFRTKYTMSRCLWLTVNTF